MVPVTYLAISILSVRSGHESRHHHRLECHIRQVKIEVRIHWEDIVLFAGGCKTIAELQPQHDGCQNPVIVSIQNMQLK